MKNQLLILALGVSLCPFYAKAQYNNTYPNQNPNYPQQGNDHDRDDRNRAQSGDPDYGNVNITSGPNISNVSGNAATLAWTTDRNAANRVEYRADGENSWHSAYEPGGSTNHAVTLSNLAPGRNYQFRILTRDNQVRTAGNFRTAGNGSYGGYNNGTYTNGGYNNGGTRNDHDNDANHADRDAHRAYSDNDRDDKNIKDKDKNKDKDKKDKDKDDQDQDHDKDSTNPR